MGNQLLFYTSYRLTENDLATLVAANEVIGAEYW